MKKVYNIGTSGYNYNHWRGVFYPQELATNKWLEYYCKFFCTVELNVSFYRLPQESMFKSWYKRTPKDFVFAVKGSRFITHIKRLEDVEEPVELFYKRAGELKEKLGVVLWQLPPSMTKDEERLLRFCELLKKTDIAKDTKHAFEFRNKTWFCENIYRILKDYNYGLCIAHPNRFPYFEKLTADFIYLRFHGGEVLYGSEYSKEELITWADKVKSWNQPLLFAYFNNDAYGFAVKNGLTFKELLLDS
jgi:uncharacterized protein YecE (DUF72 family)